MSGVGLAAQASRNAADELNQSRKELEELLTKYTDLNPQVLMKREQIANLEKVVAVGQLLKAREELDDLLTKYTDQHPLLFAKREQIAGLEKTAALQGSSEPSLPSRKVAELSQALQELNSLLTEYTDQHPRVVAKRQQIANLQKSLSSK